jgi:hypothetical protein
VSADVTATIDANCTPYWKQLGPVDGKADGVLVKAAYKSIIWYRTKAFDDARAATPSVEEGSGRLRPPSWLALGFLRPALPLGALVVFCAFQRYFVQASSPAPSNSVPSISGQRWNAGVPVPRRASR